jgi:hypothetical protein
MSKNSLVSMIRYFVSNHLYISLDTLKDYLAEKNIEFKSQVLNQTVHRLVKSGDIYDAGQGWYSSIENPYRLNRTPVEPLASQLEKQFALQEFSVWSTRQIRSHYHHLPGKFVTFIYAEKNT